MFDSEKILYEGDTGQDHYMVVERIYEGRPARVLFSGRRHAAQSGIALDDDQDLLFDYNQRFLELLSAIYPKRVLLIGGGAFTLPSALLQSLPEVQIDLVEIDPGLTQIAIRYFNFQPQSRIRIINDDGRHFLDTTDEEYDVIIIDAYSHLTIPSSLVSIQAIQAIADHLSTDGVVASNIIATYQGRRNDSLRSFIATYQTAFNKVSLFPAANGLSTWLPQNMLLVGQKKAKRPQLDAYMRYESLPLLEVSVDEAFTDG